MENASTPPTDGSKHNDVIFDVLLCNGSSGYHKRQVWTSGSSSPDATLMQGDVFWIILSILIVAGNSIVIIWRCKERREQRNSIPSILVINLAAADFLLGIQITVFVFLYSKWLCFVWLSTNATVITSLCVICAFLETACVYASGMITATIALYYAVVVFGRCCCIQRFTRARVLVLLCIEWIVVVGAAISMVILTFYEYDTRHLEVLNNSLTPEKPVNSTITTMYCLPLSWTVSEFINEFITKRNQYRLSENEAGGIIFLVMCCLVLATAVTYVSILIKLLRLKASSTLPQTLSTSSGSVGLRLIAIAAITLLGWMAYVILLITSPSSLIGQTIPYGFIALSNPVTFTLLSKPFLKAARKFKKKLLFKIKRPIPLEDETSENRSLIPSLAPSTNKEY